jgi:phage terminase large subunit
LSHVKINDCYRDCLGYSGRYLVLKGGAGSGKSVFTAQKLLIRCIQSPPHRFLVLRKVDKTIRESVWKLFITLIADYGLTDACVVNKTERTIRFKNGSEIIFAGLDDPEKIKSIAGITGIWMEESTEFTQGDFNQLDLRLRGLGHDYKQIVLSFNPIDHRHWLKKRFFDVTVPNALVLSTTYLDNAFIDDEYHVKMQSLKDEDEILYNVYALGEWGVPMAGLIYKEWKPYTSAPIDGDVVYGLDFGFNSPSALVKVTIHDERIYAEQIMYKTNLTTSGLIAELEPLGLGHAPIYCDNAEPDKIEELYNSGFNVFPADKNVKEGINKVKSLPMHIHEASDELKKELSTYKWTQDRSGILLDKPVKFNDHLLDAMRYAVYTHMKNYTGVGVW